MELKQFQKNQDFILDQALRYYNGFFIQEKP